MQSLGCQGRHDESAALLAWTVVQAHFYHLPGLGGGGISKIYNKAFNSLRYIMIVDMDLYCALLA